MRIISGNIFRRNFILGLLIHYMISVVRLNRNQKCKNLLSPFGINSMAGTKFVRKSGEKFNAYTKDDKLDFLVSSDTPYLYANK